MKSSTKKEPKSVRDIAYYKQRYQNRVFAKLASWISDESKKELLTQKDIAERIRKDPAWLSRIMSKPSNLTLDTISEILLAFDAEAEPPEIIRFIDRCAPNYAHPIISRIIGGYQNPSGQFEYISPQNLTVKGPEVNISANSGSANVPFKFAVGQQ